MKIRVGHLYPDYLNIYADRGNIAVLARRAALRGHELDVTPLGLGDAIVPGAHDLYYVGGGQDREDHRLAPDVHPAAEFGPAGQDHADQRDAEWTNEYCQVLRLRERARLNEQVHND